MLEALKFVQGAVAKKDFVPALTHFRIQNGKIKGFNGTLGICSPINIDLDIAPKAVQFVKAIAACEEEIALHMAENGKLCVRSGSFKTFVECGDKQSYPDFEPEGKMVTLGKSFVECLQKIEPFIAEDASRPWACGVLFDNESAFATNNIVLIEHWLGYNFPVRVNIPAMAIRELIRIKENPTKMQIADNRIIFHYADKQWLSTQLLVDPWPDIATLLSRIGVKGQKPLPQELWTALENILPFADEINRCYFLKDHVSTTDKSDISGTSVKVKGIPETGIYNGKQLLALKDVVTTFAFDNYPAAVPFFGKAVRGLITGIRQ